MSYSPDQLIKIAANYEQMAMKEAAAKSEDKRPPKPRPHIYCGDCGKQKKSRWNEDTEAWEIYCPSCRGAENFADDSKIAIDKQFDDILLALAKKKEKKKLDPKAKVRNRGTVCVPAEQAKDKKDHFPINDADQARNALARVHQYSSAPEWYKGSLKGLQALVARKVKAKYPKIDVGGKKEKKSSLEAELMSLAQQLDMEEQPSNVLANNALMNDKNPITGRVPGAGQRYIDGLRDQGHISDKKHAEVTTLYKSLVAARHPKKASLEHIESLLEAYGQANEPLYGEMNEYELAQAAQKGQAWEGIGSLTGEPFLRNLLRNGKISRRLYDSASNVLKMQSTPATRTPTPTAPQTQAPTGSKYSRIEPIYQTMLGVNPDGQLGPITQAALDRYKVSIGNPEMSNALVYEALKRETEYQTKQPMVYDDNSNTYVTMRQKQQTAPGLVRELPF